MAAGTKNLVEAVLYGTGEGRRFTQDSPVMLDVWAQYFEDPSARLNLLLEPWQDVAPFVVTDGLRATLGGDRADAARLIYNRTVVAADLTLDEIVRFVLPLTGWYVDTAAGASIPLPTAGQMWQDVASFVPMAEMAGPDADAAIPAAYAFPRLLAFLRMAGLIFRLAESDTADRRQVVGWLKTLINGGSRRRGLAQRALAQYAAQGWTRTGIALSPPADRLIYAVSRNREAFLAIRQSVRTVKGDAAAALFTVDCAALTWAVIDSGIDADHPAFDPGPDADDPASAAKRPRERSRVRETYDFAYLRDLLTSRDLATLPEHYRSAVAANGLGDAAAGEQNRIRIEMLQRIKRARSIDWELLRPFLRIDHGDHYVKPADSHGTHVAGILGAAWDRGTDSLHGMCPAINLIDIRVCRSDGTSDEFVIMSALQFVRHLNAHSDRLAIHGVNMSLSLEHDAAVYACGRTPVCEEAERTVASGVVVVAAAGNRGYRRMLGESNQPFDQFCPVSITDPGNAENVITVGSTHRLEPHTYGVSYFSSRGPTGDGRIKPDLVAPGEKIFAPALDGGAVRLDGTSMAAPHVSGAAAMLMARHVELIGQPMRIKKILCDTATDLGREGYFQGRGLVDVLRAIQSV